MTVETVVVKAPDNTGPSLEETAREMGIDVENVDSTATQQTAKEPSEKILGKFESVDALAKAYEELQKKLGEQSANKDKPQDETVKAPEAKEEAQPEEKPEGEKTAEEQAKEAAEKAGLDLNALSEKFWENGALEDSDYEALEKAGYPKDLVDQFIEGQMALVNLQRQTVFAEVGGERNYSDMIEWARGALSEKEIAAYDAAVNGDNMEQVLLAVKGLKARYDAEVGFEPSRTVGGSSGSRGDTSVYESVAELQRDMNDPKYWNDPAFRRRVEQKLARSNIL